jgi:hypothetical protein
MISLQFPFSMVLMVASVVFVGLLVQLNLGWAQSPNANNNNPAIFAPDSQPYGLTYSDWTAKWWQWVYSIPTANNPLLDQTGKDCTQGQNQTAPVWFLAGTSGGSAERTCTIPAGKAILFPVFNSIEIAAGADINESEEDLRARAKTGTDAVTTLEASIDGTPLQNLWNYRVQSPSFSVTFPTDNVFGISEGSYRSAADGYWVFLEPLPPGQHDIQFHGVAPDPTAASTQNVETAVTYHLTISNSTTSTM